MVLDPHLIPGFEILDRVASGGVAEVFRASRELDGQEVALKVMSLAEADPEFHPHERFDREAALLERLNHPSLPRLYGHGITPADLGWFALELVKGSPLSELKGHPTTELIPIFIQVAEALQAVAQEGIVHRDISPDNVLVEERHGRKHARLIDFGIAKDVLSSEGQGLTRHGAFIGKLAYASPEQLVGVPKGETIDFRSDVYSLGMTMYEILTGQRAVQGESLPDLVDAHLQGRHPPIVIPPERGGPAPHLVALVTKMIERSRDDRPHSWEEVLAELWRCREEASPLSETLARKRTGRSDAEGTAPPTARTEVRVLPRRALAQSLSKELVFGRVVLAFGLAAFLGAVGFAVVFVRGRAGASHEEPTKVPVPTPIALVPPPTKAVPTAVPTRAPSAAPTHEKTRSEAETGILTITLVPAGELDEARSSSGAKVASHVALPARLELPPGRYELKLVSKGTFECTRTVTVTVKAGRTTSVKESCIVVK